MNRPGIVDFLRQHQGSVLLAIFLLSWTAILVCIAKSGWVTTWNVLNIPAMYPPFADMRTVQGALASLAAGYNPQINNPGDPWGRAMNYPAVWIDIAKLAGFRNENHFILFVTSYVFGYLYSCYTLLKRSPSLYLLLAMLSGASLLAVERGNNDLVVFLMLSLALHMRRDWVRSVIVLLAVVLKLYPVLAVYGFFRKNVSYLAATAGLAAIYLALHTGEVSVIKSGNTADGYLAYGVSLGVWQMAGLLPILVLSAWLLRSSGVAGKLFANACGEHEREMFIVGGSLYVLTFVLATNWDYRLVFLLFCLPYLQSLKNKAALHTTSICVLLAMNVLWLASHGQSWLAASQFGKFFLFAAIFIALSNEILSGKSVTKDDGRILQRRNKI